MRIMSIQILRRAAVFGLLCVSAAAIAAASSPPAGALRVLSPKPGQALAHNYVIVSYELTQPASAAGLPNFQVQLDSRDPITTTDRQMTFTGLTAGKHTGMIQVVDANGVAIPGARVEVAFTVARTTSSLAPQRGNFADEGLPMLSRSEEHTSELQS